MEDDRNRGVQMTALRYKKFRLLFTGQLSSFIGINIFAFSLYWYVQTSTGDPTNLLWLGFLMTIPQLITIFGGVIADRYDRVNLLIVFEIVRVLMVVLLIAVIVLKPTFWVLSVLYLLWCISNNLSAPASQSLVPQLLPEEAWISGNGLMNGVRRMSALIAAMLSAGFLSIIDTEYFFGFYGVTLLISILTLVLIKRVKDYAPPQSHADADQDSGESESVWASLREGLKYAWDLKFLRLLLPAYILHNLLYTPFMVLTPAWSEEVIGAGAMGYGLIELALGGGAVLGFLSTSWIAKRVSMEKGFFWATGIEAAILFFPVFPNLAANLFVVAVMGFGSGVAGNFFFTLLQMKVPSKMHGRIFGMLTTIIGGIVPLGTLVSGLFVTSFGVYGAFTVSSAVIALLSFYQMFVISRVTKVSPVGADSVKG